MRPLKYDGVRTSTASAPPSAARRVAAIVARARPDALLLTGGDTARAVLGALDAHGIELDDELLTLALTVGFHVSQTEPSDLQPAR